MLLVFSKDVNDADEVYVRLLDALDSLLAQLVYRQGANNASVGVVTLKCVQY
jgi:hypothetical protein